MNRRGQSMIEFALIAVLVILGIVFMGPYVLRSVNAHFKLWDDSVQDSFTENLNQASINVIPDIPTNCTCPVSQGSCGGPGVQCAANQREYDYNCNPQGCNGAAGSSYCVTDNSCCSNYSSLGCGTVPLGVTPLPPNNCYYGNQIQGQLCGSNSSTQCIPDGNCPMPACLGIISPGALPCPNEPPVNGTTLNENIGITYVADPSSCSAPCQYYCDSSNSYFLTASGSACTRTFEVAPSSGTCPTSCNCTTNGNTVTYNCSFQICAPSQNTIISAVGLTDVSSPQTAPYCGNPGNPGEQCQISITY